MYRNHPLTGAALLEKIPRLENVAKMIELQQKRYDECTAVLKSSHLEEIILGAQILKAVIDFDRKMFRGMGRSEGMVAAEDVMAKNGVLIIPKGQTIIRPLLQGLVNFSMQVGVVEPIRVQIGPTGEHSTVEQ